MSDRPPREIIAQRYRLIEQIGKGGMGSVWRAEHTSLRTSVAIKLLDPRLANDATLRARFLREAQAAAALTSVHIVRIIDHGVDEDVPYIAMEFLPGESLRARLRRDGALSPAAAAKVLAGVARGIARAHRAGIVHRDLKPDNIFIAQDEEQGEVVKVVDFGIAKLLDEAKLSDGESPESIATATGAMLGTPYYMSPEQLRGKKHIDARTDLWSIAVIAFECLTGKRPFTADAIGELVLTICSDPTPVPSRAGPVPPGFDAWFARAASVDPDVRFQTIQELSRELADVLAPGESWMPTDPDVAASSPTLPRPSAPSNVPPARISSRGIATATTAFASEDDKKLQSATGAAHSISSVPGQKRGLSAAWYAGIAAVLVVVSGALYISSRSSSQPDAGAAANAVGAAPSPASASTPAGAEVSRSAQSLAVSASAQVDPSVTITFETVPGGLEIVRGGKKLGQAPGPLTFDRGDEEITLTFRKPGYTSRDVKLTPDTTKSVKVELVRAGRRSDELF